VRSLGHVDGSLPSPRHQERGHTCALEAALRRSAPTGNPSARIEREDGYAHSEEHPGTPSS
jgi:hypothetical protein